ncbi:MAG: ATP-binding protein [Planctomycetes bacterium]|nr:ATP-binding protein [Planctomycetota bacterium]
MKSYLAYYAAATSPLYHPFLPGPSLEEASQGDLSLGLQVVTGRGPEYEFRLQSRGLLGVSQVDGPTGAGKTITLFLLAGAAERAGASVWYFDTEGDLGRLAVAADPTIPVVTPSMYRQDLFVGPAGMELDWRQYVSKFVSTTQETLYARNGMMSMAREQALELYEKCRYFTMYDFHHHLLGKKYSLNSRDRGHWESLRGRIGGTVLPFLGLTYSGGSHDIRALMDRKMVWDLRGLSDDLLGFFTTGLLFWVSLVRHIRADPDLELLLVFDEVTRICSIERMRRAGQSELLILDMARTCRKRGLGLAAATQTPHLLPTQLNSNTNTYIVLRPSDGRSLRAVSDNLALTGEQEMHVMAMPDRTPRQAVVRVPGIAEPFLVELPDARLPMATPEEVEQRKEATRPWLDSIYVRPSAPPPSTPLFDDKEKGPVPVERPHDLSKEQIDYLVLSQTLEPVSERDSRNGISGYKGNKLREALKEKGLIRLHRVSLGGKGKVVTLTEVTEEGRRVLDRLQVRPAPSPGRGNVEHRYAQQIIFNWCVGQGYPAQIEAERQGARVDVASEWDNLKVAVEFVNEGPEKELVNVCHDLEAGYDRVVLVSVQKETLDRLRDLVMRKLEPDLVTSGRVSFTRLTAFLRDKNERDRSDEYRTRES